MESRGPNQRAIKLYVATAAPAQAGPLPKVLGDPLHSLIDRRCQRIADFYHLWEFHLEFCAPDCKDYDTAATTTCHPNYCYLIINNGTFITTQTKSRVKTRYLKGSSINMEGPRGMVLDHDPSILSNLGCTLFFQIIDSVAQRSELTKDQHFH